MYFEMKAYSVDLRRKIIDVYNEGNLLINKGNAILIPAAADAERIAKIPMII